MIVGSGIDLVQINRIRQATERWRERFLNRVFTPAERTYAFRFAHPYPRLAARFAAKEALLKALGTGLSAGTRWTEIEILSGQAGPPTVRVSGTVESLIRRLGVRDIRLSLSHDGDYSIAQVILVAESGQGKMGSPG